MRDDDLLRTDMKATAMTTILLASFFGLLLSSSGCSDGTVARDDALPVPTVAVETFCVESVDDAELLPAEPPPANTEFSFTTDFSRHTVPYGEILSGGPRKDGIPSIDEPQFLSPAEASAWLGDREPVVYVEVNDDRRIYPIQILMWHEIVNDVVGGVPVLVTFCPLCNTAIAYRRDFDGRLLDFGTTGRLRFSNLIMYDRQTETWWQQALGNAIAGEYAGRCLDPVPASIIAFEEYRNAVPDGKVLSRETGYDREYGRNPYTGYDDIDTDRPFLYRGPETDGRLAPMTRVLAVDLNDDPVAYDYVTLARERVINDVVGGVPVVVFWKEGTASALDARTVDGGADVGAAAAYRREVDGIVTTFSWNGSAFVDDATGTTWSITGEGLDGPLADTDLESVPAFNHFWFSWAVFRPSTRVWTAP